MLTVYLKRDSLKPVADQIGELVAKAVSEIDTETLSKLPLVPENPTHAHYVPLMPVLFLVSRLRGKIKCSFRPQEIIFPFILYYVC